MTAGVPDGFERFQVDGGYVGLSGPFYQRALADGKYDYGFPAEARHGNPNKVIHGAALITFIDTCFGHAVVHAANRPCATITLNAEFIAGVAPGGWVDGRVEIKRMTRTLAYLAGEVACEGQLLLAASGVWRVFEPRG